MKTGRNRFSLGCQFRTVGDSALGPRTSSRPPPRTRSGADIDERDRRTRRRQPRHGLPPLPRRAHAARGMPAHTRQLSPPPDLNRWRRIDDPRLRTEVALTQLYDYFRRTESGWSNVMPNSPPSSRRWRKRGASPTCVRRATYCWPLGQAPGAAPGAARRARPRRRLSHLADPGPARAARRPHRRRADRSPRRRDRRRLARAATARKAKEDYRFTREERLSELSAAPVVRPPRSAGSTPRPRRDRRPGTREPR
jgi:hypothetical protein